MGSKSWSSMAKGSRKRQAAARKRWSGGKFRSESAAARISSSPAPPLEEREGEAGPAAREEGEEEGVEEGEGSVTFVWKYEWFESDADGDDEAEAGDAFDEGTGDTATCKDVDNYSSALGLQTGWSWFDFGAVLEKTLPLAEKAGHKRRSGAARVSKHRRKRSKEENELAAKGSLSMMEYTTAEFDPWSQVRAACGGRAVDRVPPHTRLAPRKHLTCHSPPGTPPRAAEFGVQRD